MIDDKALVRKILDGDIQAFRLLINQHQRLVFHMVSRVVKNREEQQELSQDVFLKVFDKLGDFGFQSRLSTWIATIAYRHAINHMRKHKIQYDEYPDGDHEPVAFTEHATPESIMSEKDMDEYVLRLIEGLPAHYKMILTLYHIEEMSYPEICDITGMPEGTVKNYLFRARNLLKEKVKGYLSKEKTI